MTQCRPVRVEMRTAQVSSPFACLCGCVFLLSAVHSNEHSLINLFLSVSHFTEETFVFPLNTPTTAAEHTTRV